jgi:hypothetical protein
MRAFKKKSSFASTSRQNVEGYWLKFAKISIISFDAARSTTTTKAINRSQANTLAGQLNRHFRTRPRGIPIGLNLDTIGALRISNTAYVVRMHFNSDEGTLTTANENANRYVAGEASIHLTIGEEHATVQCEPDNASHLSVTHIVPMGKVTDLQGRTISLHNATAAKSISRKNLLEIASYLQEPQAGGFRHGVRHPGVRTDGHRQRRKPDRNRLVRTHQQGQRRTSVGGGIVTQNRAAVDTRTASNSPQAAADNDDFSLVEDDNPPTGSAQV